MKNPLEITALDSLKKLGWTDYESRVFLALYKGFRLKAEQIAKIANIPRPSVYPILRDFCSKGICTEIESRSHNEFEITDKKILEDKFNIEIELNYKNQITELKKVFTNIKPLYKVLASTTSAPQIQLIKGYNKQREQKYLDLLKNCKQSVLSMSKLQGFSNDALDFLERKLIKKGVKIRSIYEIGSTFYIKENEKWKNLKIKEFIDMCKKFEKNGELIRLIDKLPQDIIIYDNKIVFTGFSSVNLPNKEKTDVIIKSTEYAELMKDIFEMYWNKGKTIKEYEKKINKNGTNKIKK